MENLIIIAGIGFCALILYFGLKRFLDTNQKPYSIQKQSRQKAAAHNTITLVRYQNEMSIL